MIRVVKVTNPFQPATHRESMTAEHVFGLTVEELLRELSLDPLKWIAIIDGKAIPVEEAPACMVGDGSDIILMPNVGGGGFLKTFAEIAVIAVAGLVTAGIGSGFLIGGYALASATTASLIGSAVALGGNLLINAFLSPTSGGSGNDSATYDPSGPKTIGSGGVPIPKGYGTMMWGGNIIASSVDAEGADNYLNVLVCFGWGPATAINDIRINGTSIQDYQNVAYQIRVGSNDQAPIPYFNNIVNGFPQAVRCIAGTPVVVQGTGATTQGLEITCQFPQGIFYSNSDGSLRSLSIAYKVEYSVSGANNWQTLTVPRTTHDIVTFHEDGIIASYPAWVVIPNDGGYSSGIVYSTDSDPGAHYSGEPWNMTQTVNYYDPSGHHTTGPIHLSGEWQPCDPNLNQQAVDDWGSGYEIFSDANQATLYHTTRIYNLPPNKYDVRITKYGSAFTGDSIQPREANNNRTGDQVWIHNINEVQYQDLAYPNMVLLGVRALATNQLSGGQLNITAEVVHELQVSVPAELASYTHDNPALVAYDMLCSDSELYGGGVDPSQVNVADLVAWADFNDELVSDGFGGQMKRHQFNGVFDQQSTNLWKSLQRVGAMSHAIPVQIGRQYGFIIDTPVDVPAQVFTVGNIKKDSLKDTWMSLDDRANRVEVTFSDAARDFRRDEPCAVMTAADIQAGVDQQVTRVNLLGCTSRSQAWHWGYRKLQSTKLAMLTRTFDVDIAAVACQIGSVIGVQDDITQWADGGRIQTGSTAASLVIDRSDLTFAPNSGWTVSVVHPVVYRGPLTVQSIVGSQIVFTQPIPPGRVLRLKSALGREYSVLKYGGNALTIEGVQSDIFVGAVAGLYDQDVVETQTVSAVNGYSVIPASPFSQTPTPDAPWVYGQSAGAFPAKLFRVTNLRKKGDFEISIDGLIYDPAMYADDTPIIAETLGTPDIQAAVTSLNLTENYTQANGANAGQSSTISVGWQNGRDTAKVELFLSIGGVNQPLSAESQLASISKGTTFTFPASTGEILQIRAVGIDAGGNSASWGTAPIQTITVQGSGAAPLPVTYFNGNFQPGTGTIFTWNGTAGAATYEIRYNDSPSNLSWAQGTLVFAGAGLTWTDTMQRSGCYLIKAISAATVESISALSFTLQQSSAYLNALGLAASQSIGIYLSENSWDSTKKCPRVTLYCPQQTLLRSDGSSVTLPFGSISWFEPGNLQPATTYYVYTCVRLSDMTIHSAIGDPPLSPDTTPNPTSALKAGSDGYFQGPNFMFTTQNASSAGGTATGGGTGGSYTCPDGRELVETLERGKVEVASVVVGEHLLGRGRGEAEAWKRVRYVRHDRAYAWYLVNGYRMSPLDPVWYEGEWQLPYKIGTLDLGEGDRVKIEVEGGDYDSHNYYLTGRGERLLIHNVQVPATASNPC